MPLSGGAAAAAFAPVAGGLKAYINEANDKNLVPGYKLELTIEDDQYNPTLTTPAVEKLHRPDRREPDDRHDRHRPTTWPCATR